MAALVRHKRTAEHYQQWLAANQDKSKKVRYKMFDLIADADYLEIDKRVTKATAPKRVKVKKY